MTPHTAPRLALISASPRPEGTGTLLTRWLLDHLESEADHIDLARTTLPDDAELGSGGSNGTQVSDRLGAAEAFVILTPEYNRSFPGSLKRLIDWHYDAWALKPALIIGYGITGGHDAIAQLRPVLTELNMIAIRRDLGLPAPWEHTDDDRYAPSENTTQALKAALAELLWWTDLLTEARRDRPFPG